MVRTMTLRVSFVVPDRLVKDLKTTRKGSGTEKYNTILIVVYRKHMKVPATLSYLSWQLHEFVDDTEDYVNTELDFHRNQLQGMQVRV